MLMDDEDVERYLVCISTGRTIKSVDHNLFTFKFPDNILKLKANAIYAVEYEKAIKYGLLSKASLEELIKERQLFTEEDQNKIDKLNSQLDGQRVLLAKTTIVKANQDRIKGIIDKLKEKLHKLTYQKTSKLMMSAEVKANEEKTLYLCWTSVFDDKDELVWKDFHSFKHTTDIMFRDKILSYFLEFYAGISTTTMRFISRSNLWRIRYVNSLKSSEALFGVPSAEYTTDMLSLAYWSNYYDNIYQMMPEDRPSDLVIEDDDSLDAFMKFFYEERTREDATRRSKNKSPGKLSAFDSEEVIVTASNELWHDIEYDKPREAQKLKDRADIKKRTRRG